MTKLDLSTFSLNLLKYDLKKRDEVMHELRESSIWDELG